jgi:hypothetical protein
VSVGTTGKRCYLSLAGHSSAGAFIMRLNSAEAMQIAREVYEKYKSWDAAFANSDYKDGRYVLRPDPIETDSTSLPAIEKIATNR